MKRRTYISRTLAWACVVQSAFAGERDRRRIQKLPEIQQTDPGSTKTSVLDKTSASSTNDTTSPQRKLWDSSRYNKACFSRCVVKEMSGEDCRDYIYEVLESEYQLPHTKLMLPIRIDTPTSLSPFTRGGFTSSATGTEVQFRGSNIVLNHDELNDIEVGVIHIPTNVDGYVSSCHEVGTYQMISYPRKWKVKEPETDKIIEYTLPPVNCAGLLGTECCEEVMSTYTSRFIPLTNKDGRCMTCAISQVPLRARLLEVETTKEEQLMQIVYEEHTDECELVERSVERVSQTLMNMNSMVKHFLVQQIKRVLETGATCHQLELLQHDLMTYTRTIPEANAIARRLLCGMCSIGDDVIWFGIPMPTQLESHLRTILTWVEKPDAIQMVEELVIHTNADGIVTEIPKLPGSWADCKL